MKILVILLGRIGDMILLTPVFSSIKAKYPQAEIHVLAGRHNYKVIESNPNVDKIILFQKSPIKLINLIISLVRIKYDYLIDTKDHDSTESHLLARLIRAKYKIGYHSEGKIYDYILPSHIENINTHITSICYNALKPLGIEMPEGIPKPELFPSADSEEYTSRFITSLGVKPIVMINISASAPDRIWQMEKWAELINTFNSDEYHIVLSFAPAEKQYGEYLSLHCPGLAVFNSRNIKDVVSLVKASFLVISPDTSIVHVASAFDKPLIALYNHNPKIFEKFKPLSGCQLIIRAGEGKYIRDINLNEIIDGINCNYEFSSFKLLKSSE